MGLGIEGGEIFRNNIDREDILASPAQLCESRY
jgi:hypothetical protein